jgi:hypothetical protein
MRTEIIFASQNNNQGVIQQIIAEKTNQLLLTEDQVFPVEYINASIKALDSRIERVEMDEQNNVRKIYVAAASNNMLLG